MVAQKDEFTNGRDRWYGDFLAQVITQTAVDSTSVRKRAGGLPAVQTISDDVSAGDAKKTLAVNPQES